MSNKWIRHFEGLAWEAKHELGPGGAFVYKELCRYADDEGHAFPKVGTLVEATGVTRRGVTKILAVLRAAGRIEPTDWRPPKPTRATVHQLTPDRELSSLLPFKKGGRIGANSVPPPTGNSVPPPTGHSAPPSTGNSVPPSDCGKDVDKSVPEGGAGANSVHGGGELSSSPRVNSVPTMGELSSTEESLNKNNEEQFTPTPCARARGEGEGETADALPPESKPESDDWGLGDGAPKPVGKLNPVREEARQLFMAVWGEGFNDDLDAIAYAGSVYALTAKVLHEGVPLGVMLGIGGDVRLDYREKRITTRGKVFTANWKAWCREHGFTKAKEPAKQATG